MQQTRLVSCVDGGVHLLLPRGQFHAHRAAGPGIAGQHRSGQPRATWLHQPTRGEALDARERPTSQGLRRGGQVIDCLEEASAVAGNGILVHDKLARREHRRDGIGLGHTAAPVELALVLLHVVDQLALQVFAPEQRLGHRLPPRLLDTFQVLALVAGERLAADEVLQRTPILLRLLAVALHRLAAHVQTDRGTVVPLQPARVLVHPLQAEVDHLQSFDRLPVLLRDFRFAIGIGTLGATVAKGLHAAADGESGHTVGQPGERTAAVLLHRGLANHEGTGLQGARHRVVVARAGNRSAAHSGKGWGNSTAVSKAAHATAHQPTSGVCLHLAHVDRVRA